MKKGLLITLEGNEGCGKSTQIRLLSAYLKKRGYAVFLTREPGGTRVGDAIRRALLDNRNQKMTSLCETLLYMASRAQLVEQVIAPVLKKGGVVLCDRWLDATVAYQGYGHGVDLRWIKALGQKVTRGIKPALSLYLDLPVAVGLRRSKSHKKADRMEKKSLRFHKKVRRGFLAIARSDPRRFQRIVLKPTDSVGCVQTEIQKRVRDVLG